MGLRLRFWVLAILMDTGWKSSKNSRQQKGRPHMPRPPTILALSRTPICRSSMRVRNTEARFLTSSRKSTRPSAVKKNRILLPSKAHSADTSCMSRPWAWIFCWQTSKARFSFCSFSALMRSSFSVARRSTRRSGGTMSLRGTGWLPAAQIPYSWPRAVSMMT